jgi:hypothetical protein
MATITATGLELLAKLVCYKTPSPVLCRRLKPAQSINKQLIGTTKVVPCYKARAERPIQPPAEAGSGKINNGLDAGLKASSTRTIRTDHSTDNTQLKPLCAPFNRQLTTDS